MHYQIGYQKSIRFSSLALCTKCSKSYEFSLSVPRLDSGVYLYPIFSLCFNGNLKGYIKGGRGIRQWDPLSPYLFIICMEVLSRKLDSAARDGSISYHSRCKKLHNTHLCFADDLVVFTAAEPSSLLG